MTTARHEGGQHDSSCSPLSSNNDGNFIPAGRMTDFLVYRDREPGEEVSLSRVVDVSGDEIKFSPWPSSVSWLHPRS